MGLNRYIKQPDGLRQYVIFLEEMAPDKRQKFITHGLQENKKFVELALEHILSFDRLAQMPEMELTEIIASVKPKMVAYAIKSLEKEKLERVQKLIPSNMRIEVKSYEEDNPTIAEQNVARLACIKMARELEAKGVLKSIIVPKIPAGEI